jgi:hypothetical protein
MDPAAPNGHGDPAARADTRRPSVPAEEPGDFPRDVGNPFAGELLAHGNHARKRQIEPAFNDQGHGRIPGTVWLKLPHNRPIVERTRENPSFQ